MRSPVEPVRRFFRTPKGLLIAVLALLAGIAAFGSGLALVAPGLAGAVAVAMAIDAPILRYRDGEWSFPSGALLTGLIVAMVLSPHEPWHVAAITSAVGVLSKYVVRTRSANVFNPAALALVVTFYPLGTGQSWWGALPELSPLAAVALFATGIYITDRVNKVPVVLSFLGVYFLLFTVTAFVGRSRKSGRVVSRARPARGTLLRVLHGDRSADVAPEASRPAGVRRDRCGRQLRGVRAGRCGVLPAGGVAGGERVGSVEAGADEGGEGRRLDPRPCRHPPG